MSTSRMIEKLSVEHVTKTIRSSSHDTLEQELLEKCDIDTAYYHPKSHPRDTMRESFGKNISPEELMQSRLSEALSPNDATIDHISNEAGSSLKK